MNEDLAAGPRSNQPRRSRAEQVEEPSANRSAGASTRRDEILGIARAIFTQRGYTNASMRDIAEASGMLAGSLYSHFRSKSEMLRLILEPLLDLLVPAQEAALRADGTGLQRVMQMIHDVLAILVEHDEEMTILHYEWRELAPLEDLAPVAERCNRFLELWWEAVVDGIADGSIRHGVDPDTAVRTVTASLHAVVDRKRFQVLPGKAPDALEVEGVSAQLQSLFSSGLANQSKAANRPGRVRA